MILRRLGTARHIASEVKHVLECYGVLEYDIVDQRHSLNGRRVDNLVIYCMT